MPSMMYTASKSKPVRRRIRATSSRLLAALRRHPTASIAAPEASTIEQVLVVRMNRRMGNTLFLTPLLVGIHELMPRAAIDVVVTYTDAGELLRGLPGVRNVITVPRDWWRVPGMLRALRTRRYDVAIDPTPNSFGGRLVLALSRARWRLGFGGDDQWLRVDCAAPLSPEVRHDALRPLELLEHAFGYQVAGGHAQLHLGLAPDELAAGAQLLATRLGDRARGESRKVGFFASARGTKDLGTAWWQRFWQEYLALMPGTVALEVLPAAEHAPVRNDFATVHCRSPRSLAAVMAHLDYFFSADTGPMHLASASGVPTVAFFNRTNPGKFGTLKPEDTTLPITGMTPEAVARACAQLVAAHGTRP